MIGIIMRAERIARIQAAVHRKIQMIFLNKLPKIRRAHVLLLFSERILQIQRINAKLIRHHDINIVRHPSCHPVMPADGFQPPDLIHILERNAVHLIGSVLLQQRSQALDALSCTVNVRKDQNHQILFAKAACPLLLSILCGNVLHEWIRTENSFICGDGFRCRHSDIGRIHAACRPGSLSRNRIGNCRITHRIVRKLHLHMGKYGLIMYGLLLR